MERFITERSQVEPIAERLHAIWCVHNDINQSFQFNLSNRLCITAPFSRGRIFETGEEKIFKLNRNKGTKYPQSSPSAALIVTTVPIIVVFTKFDLFLAGLSRRSRGKEKISMDLAEKKFRDEHGVAFERATQNISGKIPYATVSSMFTLGDVSFVLTSSRSFTARYFRPACRNYDAKHSGEFRLIKSSCARYGSLV